MIRTKKIAFLIVICLIGLSAFGSPVSALEQKVFDGAGLLTDRERAALETLSTELGDKHQTDIIIITTNNAGGRTAEEYMADFYDEKIAEQRLSTWNAVILSIDMGRRDLYIGGFADAEYLLNYDRIETILDRITPFIQDERYYTAFERYITQTADYLNRPPSNVIIDEYGNMTVMEPDPIWMQWWLQLMIAFVIAGLVVFTLVYNSGGRVTVNNRTYLDAGNSKVVQQRDQYIRTSVTKVRKPKNTGGGGGGGRTGGGRTYSGSGRRF